MLFDANVSNIWEGCFDSSEKGNKRKSIQMGLSQTKELLHSTGNYHQNEKLAYWREDIYRQYVQ